MAKKLKILHIEDDLDYSEMFQIQMKLISNRKQEEEFSFALVPSVEEAIRKINEKKYDCIVCDYQIIGGNGLDVLKEARKRNVFTPIIFLTGQGNEQVARNVFVHGASDYFTKDVGLAGYDRFYNAIKTQIELFETSNKRKELEENERKQRKNIELLSKTAMEFVEFSPDEDIYRFIGEKLREFVGESIVIINSIDEAGEILTTRTVVGMGKLSKGIIKLLGRHPEGITYNAKDENISYLTDGRLHDYEKGLYGISLKTLPKPVCNAIEKIYGISKIYAMGFVKEKRMFGNAVIFLSKNAELENKIMIEAFVKQAAIALQKRQSEKTLEESEKQLQILIDTMPDFVCFKDGNGRWLKANDASIRIFQLEGIDYRGKKDSELAKLNSKLRGSFLTCKETDARAWERGNLVHGEETIPDSDGSVRIFDVTKAPVFHPDGEQKGIIIIGHDITERKQAEIALRKQREELSEFAHTTAHDIKNPLMVIKGYAELLKETDETGMSTKIIKQIGELDEFIRRNLALADAGKANDYAQGVDLNVLIDGIAKTTIPKNIDFMADKLPIIKCDPERWKQVFQNLFINAVEHGKPSKVWVKHEQKGNWNVIKVKDNGAGIPPKEIEKVFDRGYTTSPSNSGLGLAIVEKIVKSQRGEIKVESKEGEGTIFTIMLPIDV